MTASRPNIIILNPDEMRADILGHLGMPLSGGMPAEEAAASAMTASAVTATPISADADTGAAYCPFSPTPFLDRLVASGAFSFRYAFTTNPVCVPSRCSFSTGLYPHVHGHRTMQHLLHAGESTIFSELKAAGYHVWMNARNDLIAGGDPSLIAKHADEIYYCDRSAPENRTPSIIPEFPYSHFSGVTGNLRGDLEDTEAACERIRSWAAGSDADADTPSTANSRTVDYAAYSHNQSPACAQNRPLCLYLGFQNPHPPYAVSADYLERVKDIPLAPRIRLDETRGKCEAIHALVRESGLQDFGEKRWEEMRRIYAAQCLLIDDLIGRVLDTLKKTGLYDSSAIFILSDHGDWTGDYDLPEKAQNCFDDSLLRVPFIVKPPKNAAAAAWTTGKGSCGAEGQPGTTCILDPLVQNIDLYPTVLDYAGVTPDHDHFGRSLRPYIEQHANDLPAANGQDSGSLPAMNGRDSDALLAARDSQDPGALPTSPERQYVFAEGGRLAEELQCDEYHVSGPDGPPVGAEYRARMVVQKDHLAHEKGTMVRDKEFKYVKRLSGRDEFYDLRTDPGERINLLGGTPGAKSYDVLTAEQREALVRLKEAMLSWYQRTCDVVLRRYDQRSFR